MADKGTKLNVYNMADSGVNVTKSAIHIADGEVTKAQNAQIDPVGVLGGVRKRDGMTKLNATPMAGTITGLISLPLPDLSLLTRHFFVGVDDRGGAVTGSWWHSTNGTAWATIAAGGPPAVPVSTDHANVFDVNNGAGQNVGMTPWVKLNNRFFYPGNDYTLDAAAPTIHVWDGTTDYVLCTVPQGNAALAAGIAFCRSVHSIVPYNSTSLLVTTSDGTATARGRVLLLDVTTGLFTQIGPETDIQGSGLAMPVYPVIYQGKIWFASSNADGGGNASKVYWCRVGDATWTRDTNGDTATGVGHCTGLIVFKGDLYATYRADSLSAAIIRKRTSATGAWSTVRTSGTTGLNNFYGAPIVSLDGAKMYLYQNAGPDNGNTTVANEQQIWSTTDGAAYTQEYDIGLNNTNNLGNTGYPVFDTNGDLFWPVMNPSGAHGCILKRTAAGVWSVPLPRLATQTIRGPLTFIKY